MKKITFICSPYPDDIFLSYYIDGFKYHNLPIKRLYYAEQLENEQILIIHWARDLAAKISQMEKKWDKLIICVYDHEVYTGLIKRINWDNVDKIWFINTEVMDNFLKIYPQLKEKCFFFPLAITIEKFLTKNKTYNTDLINIGMASFDMRKRKNYNNAQKFINKLKNCRLYIRVHTTNTDVPNEPSDILNTDNSTIIIAKSENIEDYKRFWDNIDIVLSYSIHEGFHFTFAEAMLMGCYGICRKWEFGRPELFWKPMLCNNDEQIIERIENFRNLTQTQKQLEVKKQQEYIIENFDSKKLVLDLIKKLEDE